MLSTFLTFAQTTLGEPDLNTVTYNPYATDTTTDPATVAIAVIIYAIMFLVFMIPVILGKWKLFQKAGQPGWAALIPFYDFYIMLKVAGRPGWWLALYALGVIPFLGTIPALIVSIMTTNDVAKSFGKDTGWTVLLILVPYVGYPILGFSKDVHYVGPAALRGTGVPPQPQPPVAPTAYPPAI